MNFEKIFKNSYFIEHLWVTSDFLQFSFCWIYFQSDRSMIAFLSNLLIKGLWLQWRTFILSGDTSFRSSHRRCSLKTGVLRNFAKSIGKHPCQSLFVNEVTGLGLRPATLLKKRIWHRCFPVNFAKFPRTPFLIEHLWWLLTWNIRRIFKENIVNCFW